MLPCCCAIVLHTQPGQTGRPIQNAAPKASSGVFGPASQRCKATPSFPPDHGAVWPNGSANAGTAAWIPSPFHAQFVWEIKPDRCNFSSDHQPHTHAAATPSSESGGSRTGRACGILGA